MAGLMARILILCLALSATSLALPAQANIVGRASVIDGDTIEIYGQRVRLFGIDAPESAQTCDAAGTRWRCGHLAALALDEKIASRPVDCTEKDRDRYHRIVAVCRVDGEDLGAWLVVEGWAMAYRHYSTAYVAQEEAAHAAHRRIWRGTFVPPWDWRRGRRIEPTASDASDCKIKGNISAKGVRIYHIPGGQYYDRTVITPSKGEKWFCSEAEARAAGWRRSKR